MPKVQLQNLQKIFPARGRNPSMEAVKKINLEIGDGEFMVLVGPSGCGKTTTLRMIAGLEDATSGSISIDDRVVNDLPPKDRDIAMVFQNYALYPHMTVFQNMAFGLKIRKFSKSEIEERVRDAARILDLEPLLARRPKELSGGQRQRVAVGRAIVRQPKVFLFDEPLSNLDAKTRVTTRAEISKLHSRLDATMIYVTHDQVEAMTMGDRICVMDNGEIMQTAEPLELYNRPANLFVAGFIGSPPMNLLKGRIKSGDRGIAFVGSSSDKNPLRIALSGSIAERARSRDGRDIVLGIRPEDVQCGSPESSSGATTQASIEVVEPVGSETMLTLRAGSTSFIGRVDSDAAFQVGQTTEFAFDLDKVHLFDPASGEAIR